MLGDNGGGAIVNVLSVLSWFARSIGAVLRGEGSLVVANERDAAGVARPRARRWSAVKVGFMDTDMTAGLDVPKSSPDDVARLVLDGCKPASPRSWPTTSVGESKRPCREI